MIQHTTSQHFTDFTEGECHVGVGLTFKACDPTYTEVICMEQFAIFQQCSTQILKNFPEQLYIFGTFPSSMFLR